MKSFSVMKILGGCVPNSNAGSATALAPLVLCAAMLAQGRIVVAHDEWTLSNAGFSAAPSTTQFVQNVASWFSGGLAGNFRAWSSNFGLNQSSLAAAITSAGHSWSVSTAGSFDLATLQQYDGVFLVGTPVNAAVLTSYVQGGGNVYMAAGTTGQDRNLINPFLANFGLQIGPLNGWVETYAISSPHPIFAGVSSLYHASGHSISLMSGAGTISQVLVTKNGLGLYATYEGIGVYANNLPIGTGCNGAALDATSRPLVGTSWGLGLTGIPAGSLIGAISLGFANPATNLTSIGAPGCVRYTSPLADVLVPLPVGIPAYVLPLPGSTTYLGLDIFAQGAFYSPGINALGVAFSNGLRGHVGDT